MSDANDNSKNYSYNISGFLNAAVDALKIVDQKFEAFLEYFNPGFEHTKVERESTDYQWFSNHLKERNKQLQEQSDPLSSKQEEDEKSVVNTVVGFNDVKLTDFNDSFGAAFTVATISAVLTTIVANNSSGYEKTYKDAKLRFMRAHKVGLIAGAFFGVIVYADLELCNRAIFNKYFKVEN